MRIKVAVVSSDFARKFIDVQGRESPVLGELCSPRSPKSDESASLYRYIYTVSQKNVPPLNCHYLCQILIDFQTVCTAGKRMKFAINAI